MSPDLRDAVRELSRRVFGQAYRLEVMVEIGRSEDDLVNLTDLASALEVPCRMFKAHFEAWRWRA